MIKPQEIQIKDMDGLEKTFIITRFPATIGMEILYKLPTSGIPKIGDFDVLKTVRDDVFKYVYVKTDVGDIALNTHALIDNHVTDAETAYKIMGAMLSYNFDSIKKLTSSVSLDSISAKILSTAQTLLKGLSQQSSGKSKRR